MKKFITFSGLVAPMDRANVDTDAIIPKQFLKSIRRSGFGPNLFDAWRYLDIGEPDADNSGRPLDKDFVLNQTRYQGASILIARDNFGCGSSREHAPWALDDYGFKVIIAPSYADIFFNNCFKNGLLPIVLDENKINSLFDVVNEVDGYQLTIDLAKQIIIDAKGIETKFQVDAFRKHCLIEGLDDIGLTLQHIDKIKAYEKKRVVDAPWLFS